MNKSKIFNKIAKYTLVAMLALLPGTSWGLTESSKKTLLGDDGYASIAVDGTIPSGSYSLWFLENTNGEKVEIEYNCWAGQLNGNYLVVDKGINSWDIVKIKAKDGKTNEYKLVCLTSSDEKLKNLDESVAENKIVFTLLGKSDIPALYSGVIAAQYNKLCLVDDDKVAGGSVSLDNIVDYLAQTGKWTLTSDNKLSLKDHPLYLRITILDKDGKAVNPSSFTISPSLGEEMTNYPWSNPWKYKNERGIYYYNSIGEYTSVSSSDVNFKITCASDANIDDYTIRVFASDKEPSISNKLILEEPDLVAQITYNILSQANFDKIKLNKAEEPVGSKVKTVQTVFAASSTVDLTSEENLAFLKDVLSVSDLSKLTDLYVRWTLSKKGGSPISGVVCNNASLLQQNQVNWTWYSHNAGSSLEAVLKTSFTLPTDLDLSDVVFSCVVSDVYPTSLEYGYVTQEPTLKAKFEVALLDKYSMPFHHYVGHANKAFDSKGYQQTAEWEYYVYVDKDAVNLKLPFDEYYSNGNVLEPKGYFRWYDYNTDRSSNQLSAANANETKLHALNSDGQNYGLAAFNIDSYPNNNRIGVTYTPPTDAQTAAWAGEDIACDVSRYIDGMDDSKTYLLHEPTLSIRYIYHIRSAAAMADEAMNTVIGNNPERPYDRTFEDGKKVTVGLKSSGTMTLRLNLPVEYGNSKVNYTNYYFHPLKDGVYTQQGANKGFTHQVYYADEANKLVADDFDQTKLCKATKIDWWAYDLTKQYCYSLGTQNNRFFDVSMTKLNGNWMPVSMQGEGKQMTFGYGDVAYLVAYAMDDEGHRSPIANFDVRFMNTYPLTLDQIKERGLNNRTVNYLESHYQQATKPITFDDDDDDQTLEAPTAANNPDRLPSKWDRRSYGFVYKELADYTAIVNNSHTAYDLPKYSPQHGEYGIYKTANIKGISGSGASGDDGYLWHVSDQLHDRTYERTNGAQSGYFLYIDASDESRNFAAANFKANLCTGMQLICSAAVADMTGASEKPQIMFKLFGMIYDSDGNVKSKELVHSFSSGSFADNLDGDYAKGKWYQVYGKVILQKESGVERFDDFRLEIDNYCMNTDGADYAVDDIRLYVEPAKVQVLQDKPICNSENQGAIKLKIRAVHETVNAITGHKDTKIYFRFVDENGTPVTGKDYYTTVQKNKATGVETVIKNDNYATVDVFDSEATCANYLVDGTPMLEYDEEGERYLVISNRYFPLSAGKKYYVSVSTDDPSKGNAVWGNPSDICSVYSDWFEMVKQQAILTDVKGNTVTSIRVNCTGQTAVTINANLVTVDQMDGGKITLNNVKFDWYLDKVAVDKLIASETTQLKDFTGFKAGKTYKIILQPTGTQITDPNAAGYGYIEYKEGNQTYWLCPGTVEVPLRVLKDGPRLNFGFNDVVYPIDDEGFESSLRIGLPQIKKLVDESKKDKAKGYLHVPLHSASYLNGATDAKLTFVDDSQTESPATQEVYVATTNDPLWNATGATLLNTPVATLRSNELEAIVEGTQSTLDLQFSSDALANFHEGYWYELRFVYEQRGASDGTTACPGESYLKLKIVPEYVTWRPTANGGMNANWNNDANWHRSSSTELYKDDYTNYEAYVDNALAGNDETGKEEADVKVPTIDNYVPMKFTKVTIDNLKGLPFPDLGNVVYRQSTGIATKLTNAKGNEASSYIQYDIMAYWDESDANKGLGKYNNGKTVTSLPAGEENDMSCEKFYANTCHQIYFKPQGELRDQCYLVYDKAWVEKELEPNKWYTMSSPLQYIYAGDMYVPSSNGRQETEAFQDIRFTDKNLYSRSLYPVYQRAWMKSGVQQIAADKEYDASHYPTEAKAGDVDLKMGYWSHIYNKVDESYASGGDALTFGAFSIKAGNSLLPKKQDVKALLRLPKADQQYSYFDYEGMESSKKKVQVDKNGIGKMLVAYNNDESHLAPMTQSLGTNDSEFYLVANPYTCSISLKKFFEANPGLQRAAWLVEGGSVKTISNADFDKNDYVIQPTQAFFVKKNTTAGGSGNAEQISDVRFTSQMYVDRTITAGLQMASDYQTSVVVTTQDARGNKSQSRISVRPDASADYDADEDVEMLYDENLKDVPQVYTVAGSEAVAVNAVPSIDWMPLGIVRNAAQGSSQNASNGSAQSTAGDEVSLSLTGIAKLSSPLYLYDAATSSYFELHEGEAVSVEAGEHGRYFLTQSRGTITAIDHPQMDDAAAEAHVKVYSPGAGMIVASALAGETLGRVEVFTLDGKLVHRYEMPGHQRMILRVPSGVYVVNASTATSAAKASRKIAVR